MPVEEDITIDLGTNEKTFDDLDRAAAKAEKSLEKRNRELKKSMNSLTNVEKERKRESQRGGIFREKSLPSSGGGAPTDIKAPKKLSFEEKILQKARKESQKEREKLIKSLKGRIFDEDSKSNTIKNILNMGKNPLGFLTGVAKSLPILGGILAAVDIAKFIIDELVKLDKFFKAFIDIIDNRMDAFRTLQEQANIQAGLTQRIITTSSGSTEPRYSYNTFEEFNNNRAEHEVKSQMINNSGVE